MQKKCIFVDFVKSGPQNDPDSNKIIIIFIKKKTSDFPKQPVPKNLNYENKT